MTPAEVRAVVERVVAEHGQGWRAREDFSVDPPAGEYVVCRIVFWFTGDEIYVEERLKAMGQDQCARAVALWPEMQRLVAMLREALR